MVATIADTGSDTADWQVVPFEVRRTDAVTDLVPFEAPLTV
jgi:hypothetical protein